METVIQNRIFDAARRYLAFRWCPIPLAPYDDPAFPEDQRGKRPILSEWQKYCTERPTEADLATWWRKTPGANVGLACGPASGVLILDVDPDAGGEKSLEGRELPVTPAVRTGSGGRHFYFRYPECVECRNRKGFLPGLDIRAAGGQGVLPPSIHAKTGNRYAWEVAPRGLFPPESGRPDADIAELPAWLLEAARRPERTGATPAAAVNVPPLADRATRASRYLAKIPGAIEGQGGHNTTWSAALAITKGFDLPEDVAFDLLVREFNPRCLPPWTEWEIHHKVTDAARADLRTGYLLEKAHPEGENGVVRHTEGNGKAAEAAMTATAAGLTRKSYGLHDTGNAERLVDLHGRDLRFCFELGWLCWDGRSWTEDKTQEVRRRCLETVRAMAREASAEQDEDRAANLHKHVARCYSDAKIKAMLSAAESMLPLPVLVKDFDRNPWALNALNGTLDLKTGALREHRREDLITRTCPVEYHPDAECPMFRKFLEQIFHGNMELVHFVQKAVGYSLTGSTAEECLFLLHGTGANGKSTLLEALGALLGPYGLTTPTDTLMERRNDSATNDLARLRGARFVSAIETEEGRRLAESKVKALTGGDKIPARFLHKEFFEFRPEFKLWLACNHKPVVRGTDHAIWRRIRLIPFDVQIPEKERDPDLKGPDGKLQAELPGILRWAVEGCQHWQAKGLGMPEEVKAATDGYRDEMDTLGAFLGDRCIVNETANATAAQLYTAYVKWCEDGGEHALSQRKFGTRLAERGFVRYRGTANACMWNGIGVLLNG